MRISDWSSYVCSSDLIAGVPIGFGHNGIDFEHSEDRTAIEQIFGSLHPSTARTNFEHSFAWIVRTWGSAEVNGVPCPLLHGHVFAEIGRSSCGARVCQYDLIAVGT